MIDVNSKFVHSLQRNNTPTEPFQPPKHIENIVHLYNEMLNLSVYDFFLKKNKEKPSQTLRLVKLRWNFFSIFSVTET